MSTIALTPTERYRRRRLAWLQRCGLQNWESWPLFDVQKCESQAGQIWVRLLSLPPIPRDGWPHLFDELKRLEGHLRREGIVGYLQAIEIGNWSMRKWSELAGAEVYALNETHWFLRKVMAEHEPLPKTITGLMREARHGQA